MWHLVSIYFQMSLINLMYAP